MFPLTIDLSHTPGEGYWGLWGYSECPNGSYVVGLRTMVEPYQGEDNDDTDLNRAEFLCCEQKVCICTILNQPKYKEANKKFKKDHIAS